MIAFKCHGCEKGFSIKDEFAGKKTKCPKCGTSLRVPGPSSPELGSPTPTNLVYSDRPSAVIPVSKPAEIVPVLVSNRGVVDIKDCPFCSEEVLATAKKCKHCGETLDVALRSAEEARRIAEHSSRGGASAAAASTTVIVQGETRRERKDFPHFLHLFLTVITAGLWLPVWILHYIFRSN